MSGSMWLVAGSVIAGGWHGVSWSMYLQRGHNGAEQSALNSNRPIVVLNMGLSAMCLVAFGYLRATLS